MGVVSGLAAATVASPDGAASAATAPVPGGALAPAETVVTANVAGLGGVPAAAVTDGLQINDGDTILLVGQASRVENGPWVVGATAWSRPPDFASGASVRSPTIVVESGLRYAGTLWVLPVTAAIVVDTDPETWQLLSITVDQLPSSVVTSTYAAQPVVLTAPDGGHNALKLQTRGTGGVFASVALDIEAYGSGLLINQTADFSALNASAGDAIDIFLKSTGDGVCVYHQGGRPPGYTSVPGGGAAFNAFIPYDVDDVTTGRAGKVVNDRTGMIGLLIQSQATANKSPSIYVEHYANAPALQIVNQYTAFPNAGTADAISIYDAGSWSAIQVLKNTAPAVGHAAINVSTSVADPIDVYRGNDNHGYGRFLARSDGTLALGLPYPTSRPGAVRLQVNMNADGVQRTLALANSGSSGNHDGDGVLIEFDWGIGQFALIRAVLDSVAGPNGSLRLSVKAAGTMTERLRLDATGIGFFGRPPVAQQTMGAATASATYGAKEQTMLQAVYNAVRNLGLGT